MKKEFRVSSMLMHLIKGLRTLRQSQCTQGLRYVVIKLDDGSPEPVKLPCVYRVRRTFSLGALTYEQLQQRQQRLQGCMSQS